MISDRIVEGPSAKISGSGYVINIRNVKKHFDLLCFLSRTFTLTLKNTTKNIQLVCMCIREPILMPFIL